MIYTSKNIDETSRIAENLAKNLKSGDVVSLYGDMGSGKTAFVNGLVHALGYKGNATSPTFSVVNEYLGGRLPVYHFDMFRIKNCEELYFIGFEDYLNAPGVKAIEWSENIEDCLPDNSIKVRMNYIDETTRSIEILEMGEIKD